MDRGKKDEDQPTPIVVTDRRRFTESGDARDGEPAPSAEAPAVEDLPSNASAGRPAAAAAPRVAPSVPASHSEALPEDADEGSFAPEPSELGVQAVFFIFFQSAMLALGAPDPSGQSVPVDLAQARQMIELLRILERVTKGNLSADEAATLRDMLRECQMAYVQVAGALAGGGRP